MMRNSLATYKESLSRIASDVQDDAQELHLLASDDGEDAVFSDRRISHRFAQSTSPNGSPEANGINSVSKAEIELHKAEIQRLKTSEIEIKNLAMNYAAILKEKEVELSRLHEENKTLKKNSEPKALAAEASKTEYSEGLEGQLNNRRNKSTSPSVSTCTAINGRRILPKQEYLNDVSVHSGQQKESVQPTNGISRSASPTHAKYTSEIRELRSKLDKERENPANVLVKLEEQQNRNHHLLKELDELKEEREQISSEMERLRKDMDGKLLEIKQLQISRKQTDTLGESMEELRTSVLTLQNENVNLKQEKLDVEKKLKHLMDQQQKEESDNSQKTSGKLGGGHEVNSEMQEKIQQLEKSLADARKDRDKSVKELTRLKQHLLDKELEESNKMDEDSSLIEELRASISSQRAQMVNLEQSIKRETMKVEEAHRMKNEVLSQANETIDGLKKKIANYANILASRNAELLNLQTALGQYYAETEAKERLERDLVSARGESAKFSELLKEANEKVEKSRAEKEEMLSKLVQAERTVAEGKLAVQRFQEDNLRLRRTLEQSMTRINRMSLDSDNSVDRRIVIKLLLTYFERNHAKEVLDLMVRMLGFSEEEKRRISSAQQAAGKGVVRGVLGLPGRLVGGIVGGSRDSSHSTSENQSFADLWVDFLVKETEEREKRELAEAAAEAEFATVPLTSSLTGPSSTF
ncbi:golgin candidate 4-like [Wolffia australiana]